MPISPDKKALYPDDWDAISLRVRTEAGWKCELCGAENGEPHPVTGSKVVLTVAHYPDHDPANCAADNLLALCQKCHNGLDAPMRAEHSKATRQRKAAQARQDTGQKGMF